MQKKFHDFINESESRPNPRKKVIDRQLAMSNKEIGNISRFQKYQTDMDSDYRKVPMKKRAAMYDVYKKVYDLVMADPALSARFQRDLKGMLDSDLNKKGIQEQQQEQDGSVDGFERSLLFKLFDKNSELTTIFKQKQFDLEAVKEIKDIGKLQTIIGELFVLLERVLNDPTIVSKLD